MKKIMFLFAAAVVLAAVGCSKDDAALNDVQYVSELKINFDGGTRLSASHSAAGLKFAWDDGDVVYVYEDGIKGEGKYLVYDAESDLFKPKRDSDKLEVGKKYFAVTNTASPYANIQEGTGFTSVVVKLVVGAGTEYIPMISDVFTVTAENTMATMHHTVGMVEIPVKAAVDGTQLLQLWVDTERANKAISGFYEVVPVAPYPFTIVSNFYESANQLYDNHPTDLSTTEATSIFVPAFPGTYDPIDFHYKLDDKRVVVIETERSLTVERGKITKVSELVLDYIAE